ncbi:MAG TPA: hypothetical protein VMF30_10895, partial [Pirellulales bacterium]|nr:hypothetical protein [Pirellulales bacterium]
MGAALSIIIVTRPTRLEGLRAQWATTGQAKFRLASAHAAEEVLRAAETPTGVKARAGKKPATHDADFSEYQQEDATYQRAVAAVERQLDFGLPVKRLAREFVTTFDFRRAALVVVVGQDGLVANTAKYVGGLPIIAVNPDPRRIDGVLLPFQVPQVRTAADRVLSRRYQSQAVTLAEVELNDGQRMLAFNDFFLGAASHVSARYLLEFGGKQEPQSSSGILVSTGAGSTGWMSSVFNMTCGIASFLGAPLDESMRLDRSDRELLWAVREPFVSKQSRANLVAGVLK